MENENTNIPEDKIIDEKSGVPELARGWSWGGFLLSWIWGIFNGVYISLLALIPPFAPFVMIILGFKGKEWAWKKKNWDNVEHFKENQKKWAIAGIIIWVLAFVSGIANGIVHMIIG